MGKKEQKEQSNESLKTINEKKEQHQQQQQPQQHHQTHTSSFSISSQISHQSNNSLNINKSKQIENKRTFNHENYEFEPPFPSVKYIVSAETILEKLGIKTPQNTIPQTFYSSIIEPISNSFRMIRGIS